MPPRFRAQHPAARLLIPGVAIAFAVAEVLHVLGIVESPHAISSALFPFGAICIFTAWLLLFAWPVSLRTMLVVLAVGELVGLPLWWLGVSPAIACLLGPGVVAAGLELWLVIRAPQDQRSAAWALLGSTLLFLAFTFVSQPFLMLTTTMRPATIDAFYFAADQSFGFQPSFAVGRLFAAAPALAQLSSLVYMGLPFFLALALVVELRRPPSAGAWFAQAFALTAAFGWLAYFLFPAVGPVYVFPPDVWPTTTVDPQTLPPEALRVLAMVPRNCVPSLHTTWALLCWAALQRHGGWYRALGIGQLVLTELATLGLGYHWAWDLIAAVPFTLGVRAIFGPAGATRRLTLTTAWGLFVTLALLPSLSAATLVETAPIGAVLAVSVCALCWSLDRRLFEQAPAVDASPEEAGDRPSRRWLLALLTLYFVSGFAGLCYEVVFAKSLGLMFGSTLRASTLVLTVYMSGMALGAWLGGRLATRFADALKAYIGAEVLVAVWCALSPALSWLLSKAYVGLGHSVENSSSNLVPLQLLFAFALLLVPTLAMGATTPFLAKFLTDRSEKFGRSVGLLYAANTAGAATGALVTGYVLLPTLGVRQSTLLAVVLNLAAAYLALRLSKRLSAGQAQPTLPPETRAASPRDRVGSWVGFTVLTVGGFITFSLETTYIHLLSVVVGNSAFAFSLMVCCFLIGLSVGAFWSERRLRSEDTVVADLLKVECAIAVSVLLGLFLWNNVPAYFASFSDWPLTKTFATREFIRFAVCVLAMVPPAACIGAAYPLCMELIGRGSSARISALGLAASLNTVGNIAGALITGLWLVDWLGSHHTLVALAVGSAALGTLAIVALERGQRRASFALLAPLACLIAAPAAFDFDAMASGSNVYFEAHAYGKVVVASESVEGGLTTVNESFDAAGNRIMTMLTNGKFQGDDGNNFEMAAQSGFATVPLLHTPERGSALVIGLGTGVSARVLHDAAFNDISIAELSRDIATLAGRFFGRVNRDVLQQPNVHLNLTDGRNFLLLTDKAFDIISIEVSSIWFAGAANLYNRDFYSIARERLSTRGVLQQWLQLHRLSKQDLATIIGSMREEFAYVYVYRTGPQGVLVGCNWKCEPTPHNMEVIEQQQGLAEVLRLFGGTQTLRDSLLLGPDDVDVMLKKLREHTGDELVSTDDNLFLEYHTPRANIRPYRESFQTNLAFLSSFRPKPPVSPPAP